MLLLIVNVLLAIAIGFLLGRVYERHVRATTSEQVFDTEEWAMVSVLDGDYDDHGLI